MTSNPFPQRPMVQPETASRLAPEHVLTLACIRAAFGQRPAPGSHSDADWRRAVSYAARHGILPLLHAGATALELPLSADTRRALRVSTIAAEARQDSQIAPLLREVLGALESRSLEPVVLKGGALAYLAYPAPALRGMGDLDLLLPEQQIASAETALLGLGFSQRASDPIVEHHLRPFYSPRYQLAIELHASLLAEIERFPLDLAALRSRTVEVSLAGVPARTLGPEDALLLACVHLSSSHRFSYHPLRNLVDILAITDRWREALEWRQFLNLVKEAGAERGVYWPLRLSRLWLGANIQERVLEPLAPHRLALRLVAPIAQSGFILNNQPAPGKGAETLNELLAAVVLYAGYSNLGLVRGLARALVPPRAEAPDVPEQMKRSRLLYGLYLLRPQRLGAFASSAIRLWRGR